MIDEKELWRQKAKLRDEALAEARMLIADRDKQLEALRRENEEKGRELAEYRDIMSPADIRHRFEILVKLYNLLGADDVQAVDRLKETLRENEDLRARVEEFGVALNHLANEAIGSAEMASPSIGNTNAACLLRRGEESRTLLSLPTLGASTRLREKHYRECEEIAERSANKHGWNYHAPSVGRAIAAEIARAREEGR